jgi:hypothetical protein
MDHSSSRVFYVKVITFKIVIKCFITIYLQVMNLATSATTFGPAIQQYAQYLTFLAGQPNPLAQLQGNQLNILINNADQLLVASEKSLQTLNSISRVIQNQYLDKATNLRSTIQSYKYGERYNIPASIAQEKAQIANFLIQYSAVKLPCRSTVTIGKTRSTFCRLYEAIESQYKEIQKLSLQNDFGYLLNLVEKYNNRQDTTITLAEVKRNLSELQLMAQDPITRAVLGNNLVTRYDSTNRAYMSRVAQQAVQQEQNVLYRTPSVMGTTTGTMMATRPSYPGAPAMSMQTMQPTGTMMTGSRGIGSFGGMKRPASPVVSQVKRQRVAGPESIYLQSTSTTTKGGPMSEEDLLAQQYRLTNIM